MKPNLYIITLEPIEKRYTKQWYNYWKPAFSKYFNVRYIDGPKMPDKIEKGKFLDINKTNMWKAQQVFNLAELFSYDTVKKGDRFLFMDGWHFGITALKYMSQLNNIPIKIYAYWHAGSYDPYDFVTQAGLRKWACHNELGWFKACDGHFVATQFHKDMIVSFFGKNIKKVKIHVVGFPMDWQKEIKKEIGMVNVKKLPKKDLVVFPHRVDPEKSPQVFDSIARQLPEFEFVKTMEVTKNKKEYYNLIKDAKIIFSANLQETYGIGTVEAMMLGALPVVPNTLSYKEMYDGHFKYISRKSAIDKIKYLIKNYWSPVLQKALTENQEKLRQQSLDSVPKMANVMLK